MSLPSEAGKVESATLCSFSDISDGIPIGRACLYGRFELVPPPIQESRLNHTNLIRKNIPNKG